MDLSGLFMGQLTREQRAKLTRFADAAEALADLVDHGTLTIVYYGRMGDVVANRKVEFELDRRVRPEVAGRPAPSDPRPDGQKRRG